MNVKIDYYEHAERTYIDPPAGRMVREGFLEKVTPELGLKG